MLRGLFLSAIGVSLVLAGLIQLVPYGRSHTNPPVTAEPQWDSPVTRALAVRACYACHSNQTEWPWYTNVAPVSWLAEHDVESGRRALNFSAMDQPQPNAARASQDVLDGRMPRFYYVWAHPEAQLSATEQQALARGLAATFSTTARASNSHGPGG